MLEYGEDLYKSCPLSDPILPSPCPEMPSPSHVPHAPLPPSATLPAQSSHMAGCSVNGVAQASLPTPPPL